MDEKTPYLLRLKEADTERLHEITSSGGRARAEKFPKGYFTAKMRAAKATKRRRTDLQAAEAALAAAQAELDALRARNGGAG